MKQLGQMVNAANLAPTAFSSARTSLSSFLVPQGVSITLEGMGEGDGMCNVE
jgi:hypothetical protein